MKLTATMRTKRGVIQAAWLIDAFQSEARYRKEVVRRKAGCRIEAVKGEKGRREGRQKQKGGNGEDASHIESRAMKPRVLRGS